MSGPYRPPHPGRTPEERAALDAIGRGDLSPTMSSDTRDALLAAGLILPANEKVIGQGPDGPVTAPQYDMDLVTHATWSNAVAISDKQLSVFEAAMHALDDNPSIASVSFPPPGPDDGFFGWHLDREFRARRALPEEIEDRWSGPIRDGHTIWCVVCRQYETSRLFELPDGEQPENDDVSLGRLFYKVGGPL